MKLSKICLCALVGLAGLILMGRHGQALPVAMTANKVVIPPNADNKVIIYPTADENIGQLKEKGIQKVKNYGSYWLVEATDSQVDELTRMYGARAVKDTRLNRIQLSAVWFDTTDKEPAIPENLREKEVSGKRFRLVQFRGPVTSEWLHQLAAAGSVEVVSYVPNDAYLVRIDEVAEKRLREIQAEGGPIQWVGAYHPFYKIAPTLSKAETKDQSLVDIKVAVTAGQDLPKALKELDKFGITRNSYDLGQQKVVMMTVPRSDITRMARLSDVIWIEDIQPKVTLDEVQGLILAGQTNGPGFGPDGAVVGITNYLDFLINSVGGGLASFLDPTTYAIVDVADTGYDIGGEGSQFSLGGRIVYALPGNGGWFSGATVDNGCQALNINWLGSEDFYDHGTPVASIIAGFDQSTNVTGILSIFSTIQTQVFTSLPASCVSNDSETLQFTFPAAQVNQDGTVCDLVTGLTFACTGPGPVTTNLAIATEVIVTDKVNFVSQDPSGFNFGMGISPFGLIGISRIFRQSADTTGNPPHVRFLPPVQPLTTCMEGNFPEVLFNTYLDGARIENNSWSSVLQTNATNGGVYNTDSAAYDIGVRDALREGNFNNGSSNGVPGPSPLNQEYIIVFAGADRLSDAGASSVNGGFGDILQTPPSTAKNVITVTAAESVRLDGSSCAPGDSDNSFQLWQHSAFGPTLDGRFKPEIVAPGTSIYGAKDMLGARIDPVNGIVPALVSDPNGFLGGDTIFDSSVTNLYCPPSGFFTNFTRDASAGFAAPIAPAGEFYECDTGSSYAAPAVSGAIQLLWWYFQHRLTNEVGQALLQPSPAMAKAYVCNAARYLPLTNPQTGATDTLPSIAQGMGELDLARMFDGAGRVIRDESSPRAIDVALITTNPAIQQTYFSQSGQSYEVSGQVSDPTKPFRVTLAWTDAPGTPLASGAELVNDLDLQVTVGGAVYKGNVFSEDHSIPGGAFDSVNNLESVFLPAGHTGIWSVIVRAKNIAGDGVPNVGSSNDQDFALVVYNAATNTLSDVPNLSLQTNNSCQTALILDQFPTTFANVLSSNTYANVQPSPTAGLGGIDEFFKIAQPTAGTTFTINTIGSDFNTVLSVWEVQVVPQTVFVRGDCGSLVELVSSAGFGPQLTFTADGSNNYYIVAEPLNGGPGGNLVVNVNRACGLILSPTQLPSSFPGVPYNAQISATGGSLPITFAVTSGTLPPGLALQPDGKLLGSPTKTGSFTFTVTATDALGCTGSSTFTIQITCPSLTLSPAAMPNGLLGHVYSQAISASGGQPPLSFFLKNGPLPPGLVLTNIGNSGVITGTPTAQGVFSFQVQGADSNGCAGTLFTTISIHCPTITISPGILPQGQEFVVYNPQTLTASGGAPPFTFSQTAGSLPAGMTLTSAGVIAGTPTSVSSAFTVTATDNNGCNGSLDFVLTLVDPNAPVTISVTPTNLAAGVVGQNYNHGLIAKGGTSPYHFTIANGSLPPGLNLSTSGAVSGIPTNAGLFSFAIQVTDSTTGTNLSPYAINVANRADLAISSSFSPGAVLVSSNLTCSVTVTNLGPSPATGVTVSNSLPAGAGFVSASTGCALVGGKLVCDVGDLAVGAGARLSYIVTNTTPGVVNATATVSANETDPNAANNSTVAGGVVAPPYTVASNPKAITDGDGDIVSATLKGAGTMEVHLIGGNNPIDSIVLTGTDATSSLTIQVKKAKSGDGFVNIGSIVSDGGLKSITGKAVNLTGAGVQLGGSLGSLAVHAISHSSLTVNGQIKTVQVGTFDASMITAERVMGSIKLGTVPTQNGNPEFGIQVQEAGGALSVSNPRLKGKITALSNLATGNFHVVVQ